MGTGKYKIGARVRDEDGDEGVIVGKRRGEREVDYDRYGKIWRRKSALTPITDPTPDWQPKVGDRVRFTDECREYWWFGPQKKYKDGTVSKTDGCGELPIHVRCSNGETAFVNADQIEPLPVAAEAQGEGEPDNWVPEVGQRVNWTRTRDCWQGAIVEEIKGDHLPWPYILRDTRGLTGAFPLNELEPAPFTIEPGKYYRTRDGRKVGPMVRRPHYLGEYPWTDEEGETFPDDSWRDDGFYYFTGDIDDIDLVAEWVDEDPVAVAPATATPAEPKFKVGDRVRVKGDDREFVVATRNDKGLMSLRSCSGHIGFEWWRDDELVLVDSTIRPGQFATLRVTVTGISGKHANVNIPGLRNPSHGVPLSALTAA